jgi:hypothetical protein
MILDKLRRNLKARNLKVLELCGGSEGKTNCIEFKNALKKIGVLSKEVDRILEMVVVNKEGLIDLKAFSNKIQRME